MTKQVHLGIKYNADQRLARQFIWDDATKYILMYGSGGSGKSLLGMGDCILLRAMAAPGSRHIIFRASSVSCRQTLFDKTLRETFRLYYPGLLEQCVINETEMTVELPNGSMIFFNGLNDETRMQKVLGDEFNTIWLNECNEFTYRHVSLLVGRLRYKALREDPDHDGEPLKNKMIFDCNPASKKSWEYLAFIKGVNPTDGNKMDRPREWRAIKLRVAANLANLSEDYVENMESTMSAADRRRYIDGEWANDHPGALFTDSNIAEHRIPLDKGKTSPADAFEAIGRDLVRIVIGVDPNASNNKDSDSTGIIVAAKADNGHIYILRDLTMKGTPLQWAQVVSNVYYDWQCDKVVAERNNGGLMVEETLRRGMTNLPIQLVWASHGKLTRAEPVSALYERGMVHHVGKFDKLEEEMTEYGMNGSSKSPDHMDAMVWAVWSLADLGAKGPQPVKTRTSQRLR